MGLLPGSWLAARIAEVTSYQNTGVDPGFLERGFACIKVYMGVRFAVFISFFLLRPNYFIFIGYLKTGAERGFALPLEPSLDQPHTHV